MAKRLYKSQNRMLFGVCGGVADFFGIDPTIIRLGIVVISIAGVGAGVIAYIIAAIIMPDRPFSYDERERDNMRSANEYDRADEDFDKYFDKDGKKKKNSE